MATYRELVGKKIKKVTSDPSNSIDGQMWYNSTTGALRGLALTSAWSSASQLGTGRYLSGGFGSQTAGVVTMGAIPPGASPQTITEHYDGTGWSNATAYPTGGFSGGGAGTQTAGLLAGGTPGRTTAANEYDGSSWTSTGSVPVACDSFSLCGEGTQSNIIGAIGRTPATGNSGTNISVTYNGSVFGSAPNLNTARMYGNHAGTGTGTAGLIFGGFIDPSPNAMTNCEEYDGSSWSNTGSLNVAGSFLNGFGTQSDTVTNVNTPNYAGTERYNGTSWTALPNMGVSSPGGLYGNAAGTSGTKGYITTLGPTLAATEEFNESTNVITAAAWASGGTYPTNIYGSAGAGNTPAGLVFGGYNGSAGVTTTSEYDGSTFSSGGSLPVAKRYLAGFGTQTAALGAKGRVPTGSPSTVTTSEEYDGSSWTSGGTASVAASLLSGSGTQTSGLVFGGTTPPYTNSTEEYNGSSWTTGGNLGTARANHSGSVGGTQTAALAFFGDDGSTPLTLNTEEYNGTSWSEQNNVPAGRFAGGGAGTQTAGYGFGGYTAPGTPNQTTSTIRYDGTSWATSVNMATARGYNSGSAGTGPAGIFTVGDFPVANSTEQLTEETSTPNIETFSTS